MKTRRKNDLDDARLVPLVVAARSGDHQAWAELQALCRPLIDAKIRRNFNQDAQEDMRQSGVVGLWEAVLRFDPDHPAGKSFATVATYRIAYAIENYIAEVGGTVTVPRTQLNKVRRILRAMEDYIAENPGAADPETTMSDEDLDALTGVSDSRATLAAVGYSEVIVGDPGHAQMSVSPSVEDLMFDAELARDQDIIETCIDIMDAHGDPGLQRELARACAERWELEPEMAERILTAARNRTRSWGARAEARAEQEVDEG